MIMEGNIIMVLYGFLLCTGESTELGIGGCKGLFEAFECFVTFGIHVKLVIIIVVSGGGSGSGMIVVVGYGRSSGGDCGGSSDGGGILRSLKSLVRNG